MPPSPAAVPAPVVAPAAPPRGVVAWRTAVFLVFAANGLAMATWIARMPALRDHLALATSTVGLLVLSVSVGAILGMIVGGHLVAWAGDRIVLQIALALTGVSLFVVAGGGFVLDSGIVAAIGFAIFGFSSGITDLAMNISGSGVERATNSPIMPWFHASWSLGTVTGAFAGSGLAFAGVSPLAHLPAVGAIVLVVALLIVRWLPRDSTAGTLEEGAAKPGFGERMRIWLEPRTLLIGLIMLGMAFTEGSANDWVALAFIDGRGLDNGGGAFAFGLFATAMTVGRIAGVPLLRRFGRVAVLRGASLAAAVGLAVVILVPVVPIGLAGVVLWGLGASLGFPVGISAAADDPRTAAARVSAVTTVGYTAFLVGPPLIGFVGEHIGLLNALWIVLALIVVATLAVPAARPPQARPSEASPTA
ncbi:MAG: MFS transporter [Actinomycetales bacterium]|nr:MFS transporter [Actinomycetales bacterium]